MTPRREPPPPDTIQWTDDEDAAAGENEIDFVGDAENAAEHTNRNVITIRESSELQVRGGTSRVRPPQEMPVA
jgi:hypothetical protein